MVQYLTAKKIGLIIGCRGNLCPDRLIFYQCKDGVVPKESLDPIEWVEVMSQITLGYAPFDSVKQVLSDDTPVWRNKTEFHLSDDEYNSQKYWGDADNVEVEFLDVSGVEQVIDNLLKIGLQ